MTSSISRCAGRVSRGIQRYCLHAYVYRGDIARGSGVTVPGG